MKQSFPILTSTQRFLFRPFRWLLIRFFPRLFLSLQYRFITGHKLNLDHPIRYTEKLQYLRWKVYPFNPLVIQATDRIGMRDFVTTLGLAQHLIPLLGVYHSAEAIPFTQLQKPYVIKATHGSNMNYFVKKQGDENLALIKKKINTWLKTDYGKLTLEPHYSKIKPRIMIEQFLISPFEFPIEYKLHVFNGTVKFLYVVTNRGKDIRYTLYDRHWKPFDGAQFNGWKKSDLPINQPRQFDQMLTIAEKLGQSFPFVRVDLYAMLDKIYVSELTFTPAKGTLRLDDDQTDFIIGEWLNVHEKK
jgi:hypothetical protein